VTPKGRPATNGLGPGTVLADRYRLENRVAAGGMGEVWRATDTLLERNVAVKLLRSSLAEDPVVSERFRREALLAAQISHPNMAGVYDYVQSTGRPGIVMEFVDGETLAERLAREERLGVAESVRIGGGVLSALRAAHTTGIVHRDVKPGNVMLGAAGEVKVTDFGIARAASDHMLTETGMVIGTAHYLSPEQVGGSPATPASDLYSVGAILFEMLAGRRPFEAETPIAVAMKRLTEDPPTVRSLRPDTPQPVARVIARALAREPGDRYGSAEEMRVALEEAFAETQPPTQPQPIGGPTEVLPVGEAVVTAAAMTTEALRPPVAAPKPKTPRAPKPRNRARGRKAAFVAIAALVVGSLIFLALAQRGTTVVAVPPFKGMTLQQAKDQAGKLGLTLVANAQNSQLPIGQVTNQDIRAGTRVAALTKVTLTVSNGWPVPDVMGQDQDRAEQTLRDQGFTFVVMQDTTQTDQLGTVISQSPAGNSLSQYGSQVAIVVATAPPRRHGKGKGGGD